MMLAPGCRYTIIMTAGLPLARPSVAHVLHGIDDLADVGQAHRRAVAVGDDQRLVVRGLAAPGRWR